MNALALTFVFAFGFAVFVFFAVWVGLEAYRKRKAKNKNFVFFSGALLDPLWAATSFSIGIMIATFVFVPLVIEPIRSETLLLSKDGKEVRETFAEGTSLFVWDERLKGTRVVSYALMVESVAMKLNPITDNPKVRELFYRVQIDAFGDPISRLNFAKISAGRTVWQFAAFYLYEFNEKNSRYLSKFYNPLDPEQQKEFSEAVGNFLSPFFQNAGIRFKSAKFSLNQGLSL